MKQIIEHYFQLNKHHTTIRKELTAGVITFLTMSYILVVNPNILAQAGMDREALFTTTALATIFATLMMGLYAKLPIAQAPGMGLNSFFTFTVVLTMGYTWQFALTAVFIEGIIFLLLTFFNIRELIVKNIPVILKESIPVGIGLFITLIGLKGAGIIISDTNTLVRLGDFSQHNVWIAFLGLLVTGVLFARNVNGAILLGILVATGFGFILGDVVWPSTAIVALPPSIEPIFGQALAPMLTEEGWKQILSLDMLVVVFTFLFVNLFDTVGTLIGVISKTNLADADGNFPQMKKALFSDALGTTFGAVLGTSSVTSYVESASGVASGGRTGLTAVGVALMFGLSLFLAPLFLMIPAAATSPALIIVGLFMISSVSKINFDDMSEGLPAFLTIVLMPFTYSIAEGIVFGILSFTFLKLFTGKYRQITLTLAVLSILFLVKIILEVVYK
ncbi:NCS2 family permease [Flavobacterium sp. HSC-61S13]|uniref:NCS2 family permease n=1 Tax=Flavobacterium sp. HSC-61S13 TaxID=2910963 RepID=UPI00209E2814|nr:NCS2 family permease [Flavobacterium sp. HSC-61S13]MCP1997077.1 AGZA family xanthine/uracil permease-like MFS transporter [Flavobacterium sp. HSC-61S13]